VESSGFCPISSIVLGHFPGETVESSGFSPISSIVLGHFLVQTVESSGFCPISSIVLGHFPEQTVENQDKYITLAYLRPRILTRALTTTKQHASYSVNSVFSRPYG
jgi:hypothetical protein